ncbi:MAG TPA: FdtA/QdtA family cupin domain-containing protein [Ramlibacter sp.]|uniref:sugar 3,4-ketoisomerase n=1 Tax=Ramlibacter sp. TaxID=1917967 RepID=UPI002BBACB35|nr:FdtA/QdtA family cupin domain-containing protein [Ramlibacter sp.]HVZ44519.1 FdtA/QdtA family cupin domain-containing protein [Ramlibacter sp.]
MQSQPEPQCRLIELPRIAAANGDLTFLDSGPHVPFAVRRVYYLYDVPAGARRGSHAHRQLQQFLVAVAGSFDVWIDSGAGRARYRLDRPDRGLCVVPMTWIELTDFSAGAVCLVLASDDHREDDYVRDYDEFLAARRAR